MSLGVRDYIGTVNAGDTAELYAHLRINEQPVTQDQIVSVAFTVQSPSIMQQIADGYTLPASSITLTSVENLPTFGSFLVQDSIAVESLSYTGISGNTLTGVTGGSSGAIINANVNAVFINSTTADGTVLTDGAGFLRWTNTTMIGEYLAQAQFTLMTGEIRSVMTNFTVIDPFNPPQPSDIDLLVEQVILRLEDCFDSNEGGPWLRDRTMAHFDASKIASFIPEALLDINVQMPPTNFGLDYFTTSGSPELPDSMNPNMPLLVKGTLCLVIRHLMRSYVEQYTPTGQGQLVWPDRTRYQQMWGQVYQIEQADYIAAVRLWKRTLLGLGHSALLTFSKAGRLYPYGSMRARGIYRGFG